MEPSELENKEPETQPEAEPETIPEIAAEAEPEFVPDAEPEKAPAEAKPGKVISMKSFAAILVAVCLVFGAVIGVIVYRNNHKKDDEQPAAVETEDGGVDLSAIRTAYDGDEIVMTINGSDVKWNEYYYWISYGINMIQGYVGNVDDWNAEFYDGQTYSEYVLSTAEASCKQYHSLEIMAAENGIRLTDEDIQYLAEQRLSDMTAYCGEGATEEDFRAYLAERNMTPEIYDYISTTYQLYQSGFTQLYGEKGEKCTDEMIQDFLADNSYMNANHILFMTVDPATGEELDEATVAEKLAQAEALVEELRAIEDTDELVAHFVELKEEFCEDTGKVQFPDGYVFVPGTMVTEFEDAILSLADYEVSDPVKTAYGYHIILRLPLGIVTRDTVIDMSYGYTAVDVVAANAYAELVQGYFDKAELKYMPAFENLSVADLLK